MYTDFRFLLIQWKRMISGCSRSLARCVLRRRSNYVVFSFSIIVPTEEDAMCVIVDIHTRKHWNTKRLIVAHQKRGNCNFWFRICFLCSNPCILMVFLCVFLIYIYFVQHAISCEKIQNATIFWMRTKFRMRIWKMTIDTTIYRYNQRSLGGKYTSVKIKWKIANV